MFDAWGKIPSGLLEGNFNHLGQFDECLSVEGEFQEVSGKYCERGLILFGKLSIAVCIPSVCTLAPLEESSELIQVNPSFCQTNDTYSEFTSADVYVTLVYNIYNY